MVLNSIVEHFLILVGHGTTLKPAASKTSHPQFVKMFAYLSSFTEGLVDRFSMIMNMCETHLLGK